MGKSNDETGGLKLTESEIRSVIRGELRLSLTERSHSGLELSILVGDAMLDGLREVVVQAARNPEVQRAAKSALGADPRHVAEQIVGVLLTKDHDFRTDLVSLVAAMVKRAQKE